MAGLGPHGSEADAEVLRSKRPMPRPRPRPRTILTSDTDDDNDIDDDLVDDEEEDDAPEKAVTGSTRRPASGRRRRAPRSRSRSRSLTSLTDGESGDAVGHNRLTNHFRILEINGSQGSLSQVRCCGCCRRRGARDVPQPSTPTPPLLAQPFGATFPSAAARPAAG